MSESIQFRAIIEDKLLKSGERQRLKSEFQSKLEKSEFPTLLQKEIKDFSNVNELIQELRPKALELVPAELKQELLLKIKMFLKDSQGL